MEIKKYEEYLDSFKTQCNTGEEGNISIGGKVIGTQSDGTDTLILNTIGMVSKTLGEKDFLSGKTVLRQDNLVELLDPKLFDTSFLKKAIGKNDQGRVKKEVSELLCYAQVNHEYDSIF